MIAFLSIPPRYRFRCCGKSFCSTDCFNNHQNCSEAVAETVSTPQTIRKRWARTDNLDLNLDESELLSDDVLEAVSRDESIKLKLSEPCIQNLLSKLDNSRDRRYTFSKLYDSSDVFRVFIDEVATLIDFTPDR